MPSAFRTHNTDASSVCLEDGRLTTFNEYWPHSDDTLCSRENMAKAGFYYNGRQDEVKCFVCNIKLAGWDPEADDPWQKHQELANECLFARLGKDEGSLTVEQWCDIICVRTIKALDYKFEKLLED